MFYGIIIRLYLIDNKHHNIPHIHAKYGEFEASIAKHVKVDIITWVAGHRPALVFRNLETTTLLYLAISALLTEKYWLVNCPGSSYA
ncbi:hypothetical protein GlitD10_1953 [Gloeomargarita lithophora Alchichica-D10]|uniref:DUF4160 domain-containing protein n=2 Tax=Gloeomargarita TaxID=1188227 RepID=A0A1J0AEE1_9CYAN|nr:hypothetical protein GlitD10_1953 [Gloeomargarita lithophora Alchichica-D10]